MSISADSSPDSSPQGFPETSGAENRESSSTASTALPNVFVTPPEEEYDTPPWCCFDAVKDAQPGALAYEDLINVEFDYSTIADDCSFGSDSALAMLADREEQDDVFVMYSLVEEAENLREKLKSLELSVHDRPTPALPAAENISGEPDAVPVVPSSYIEPEPPKVHRTKSFFSFKPTGRKKPRKEKASSAVSAGSSSEYEIGTSIDEGRDYEMVQRTDTVSELPSSQSTLRKPSLFSRRFKFAPKKTTRGGAIGLGPKAKPSVNTHRSCETLITSTPRASQDQVKRRFSFFDLTRRFSTSSQSTITTVPSIVPCMNFSSSSLATSSVPPTPGGASSLFISPPSTPIEESSKILPSEDPFVPSVALMSTADVSLVENLAASLTLPSARSGSLESFALDPLHFESLQFNSDDFP